VATSPPEDPPLEKDERGDRGEEQSHPWMALVLVLVSLAFFGLLAELTMRLLWTNPYVNESTDYLIRLRLQPANRDMQFDRSLIDPENPTARFRTNERSYILPANQFESPDATVAFLGASTTQNAFVQEDLRFHGLVSRLLAERGLEVNTLNPAYSGITTQESINVLLNHVVFDDPDIAVMMEAYADLGRLNRDGEYDHRRVEVATFENTLRWVSQRLSTRSSLVGALQWWWSTRVRVVAPAAPRVLPHRVPYEKYVARLEAFIGICRAFDIVPVLMTQPVINMRNALTPDWHDPHGQEIFNHLIRRVGEEQGIVVIDLVKYLFDEVEDWDVPMKVFYDGVHVNDYGSQVLAVHIADRLEGVVRAVKERRALPPEDWVPEWRPQSAP
jgi:lysophospholipase L1-like esterase